MTTAAAKKGYDAKGAIKSLATTMKEAQVGEKIVELLVSEVRNDPQQRRKQMDPTALQELADSVRVQGVLQPIVVRRNPDAEETAKYIIVYGERRWRASGMAKKKTIPAVIREFSPDDVGKLWIVQLVENIQREDMTLRDQVSSIIDLQGEGWSNDDIAEYLGKPKSWISKLASIGKAGGAVAEAIEADVTADGEALYQLNKLQKDDAGVAERLVRKSISSGVPLNRQQIKIELDKRKDGAEAPKDTKSSGVGRGLDNLLAQRPDGDGHGKGEVSHAKPAAGEKHNANNAHPPLLECLSAKRDGKHIVVETDRGSLLFSEALVSAVKAL